MQSIEVAAHLLEIDMSNDPDMDEKIHNGLVERFGVDYDTFDGIVQALLPMTPVLQSPLTGALNHCFGFVYEGDFISLMQVESTTVAS